MTAKLMKVVVECSACDGTGLYQGTCEPKGVAVVCLCCNGKGGTYFKYKPFTKRKTKKGIREVRCSAGSFIAGPVGPCGSSITYEQFQAGKMPKYNERKNTWV